MGKTAVDIVVHLALLAAATALVLLWNESRDNGRYQFQAGDAAVQHYRGRLAAPSQREPRLFRLDTRTGQVWELTQTLYEDTGFVTYLGYWTRVDTMYRFVGLDSLRAQ